MSASRAINKSDEAEIRVLLEKKNLIEAEIDFINTFIKNRLKELKAEWHELSDANIGRDYGKSQCVIAALRKGKTYKTVR